MQPRAALSVDFEFFQHLPAYRGASGRAPRPAIGRSGVDFLLESFDNAGVTSTFFTVSDIVASHPDLVSRVAEAGHELGSHTHSHRHLSDLRADQRREELQASKARLEAVGTDPVHGFRAPSFDLAEDHFEMLAETGYEYDSSVVPSRSIPGWYGGDFDTRRPSSAAAVDPSAPASLTEAPVAVMPGVRLPLTGTWIRFFGVGYTIAGMRLLARRGIPPVLYVHPWEFVDLPAVDGVPRRVYLRTGGYMRRAVVRILAQPFEFVTVGALAADASGESGADASGVPGEADPTAGGTDE